MVDLSNLDGANGFVLNGISAEDLTGRSVSSAGDVNGDGIDDIIIGAMLGDTNGKINAGASYVVYGSTGDFGASLKLSDLNGSNGFVINGVDMYDQSGSSVSSAGDINGDGIGDLIIGAITADPNGQSSAGESYVVFGSTDGFGASFDLSDLNGSNGFVINGITSTDHSGWSVSSAGDVNGDGIDDVIIAAAGALNQIGLDVAGEAYVVFGSTAGFGASLELSDLNGSNGFLIINETAIFDPRSLLSVSSAGDINGDGFDDVVIGSFGTYNNFSSRGYSYVVYGSTDGFGASIDVADLNGSDGFTIVGAEFRSLTSRSVSSAGDINGDGIDDLIIGAFRATPNEERFAGKSYVVFGSTAGFGAEFYLAELDGSSGFVINGVDRNDYSGVSVSGAGDVNGDGIDDLIIGADAASVNQYSGSGASYVVFGSSNGFAESFDLSSLNGVNGFEISGINSGDRVGRSVSSAGDINGDGFDDLLIGADYADLIGNNDNGGKSYVVFGGTSPATAGDDNLFGGNFSDTINGLAGNDTITGKSGNDILDGLDGLDSLIGGSGADTLTGGTGADILDGGAGADVASYASSGSAVTVNLQTGVTSGGDAIGDTLIDIEGLEGSVFADSLSGNNGANTLLGGSGADTLTGGTGADILDGGAGADVASYVSSGSAVTVNLQAGVTSGGDAVGDTLIDIEGLEGSVFADRLSGDNGANTLLGGAGADTLIGNAGNDTLRGDDGDDRLFAGFGNDRAEGGAGNDLLKTGPGRDTLLGGDGDDTLGASNRSDLLRGEAGNDLMLGSNGNDRLFGGDGNDTMLGGNGRDTLQGDAGTDRLVGGGNTDTASYVNAAAGVQVRLWAGDGTKGEATGDQLIDIENLAGSGFNDTLSGDDSVNRIDGKLGNDIIQGLGGADQLIGGRGNDTIQGGAGNDTFLYFNGDGADTITDFTAGAGTDDAIRLFGLGSAFDSFAEVIAASSDNGADTTIDFGGGNTILLQGVTVGDLHLDDFIFG